MQRLTTDSNVEWPAGTTDPVVMVSDVHYWWVVSISEDVDVESWCFKSISELLFTVDYCYSQ